MHVSALVLADAVNTREGLLGLLGGGVTAIRRASFPSPLLSDTGVIVSHRVRDTRVELTLTFRKDGESAPLAELGIKGTLAVPEGVPTDYPAATCLAFETEDVAIPGPGIYTLTASLAHGKGMSIKFAAALTDDEGQLSFSDQGIIPEVEEAPTLPS